MKKIPAPAVVSIAVGLTVFLMSVSSVADETKCTVRVAATYSMSNRVDVWARGFMDQHPDCSVVVTGTSTNAAVQSLLDGSVDLCFAGRKISVQERKAASDKGVTLGERLILRDGIAVITHPRLPVEEVTVEQVGKMFSGQYANWAQVGGPNLPITIWATNPEHSSTAEIFQDQVLKGASMAHTARLVARLKYVIENVSRTEGSIGYISYLYLIDNRGPDTRVVKILKTKKDQGSDAVAPSQDTIKAGTYPLVKAVHCYWQEGPGREWVKRFVEFFQPGLM
ncbi:MAG: substrate-binding domain-containing protein [Thermodesulfobacteriota bacterium]